MRRFNIRIAGGILLVVAGVLSLLQALDVLRGGWDILWAVLFGGGGLIFLYIFLADRSQWWPLIPGFALLSLGILIGLAQALPHVAGAVGGPIFMGGISLGFWLVYVMNRQNWWAIIPGGVMLTIALVAGLSSAFGGVELGGVFFLGLALTFALLAFLPTPQGRMRWALIPAAVLFVLGFVVMAVSESMLGYLWPVALILVGLFLLVRMFVLRGRQQ